jgi:hypothetical protein
MYNGAISSPSVSFWRKLREQVRPVARDDAGYLVVDLGDVVEPSSICWRSISSSSGLRGRPCRNSIGIFGLPFAQPRTKR